MSAIHTKIFCSFTSNLVNTTQGKKNSNLVSIRQVHILKQKYKAPILSGTVLYSQSTKSAHKTLVDET